VSDIAARGSRVLLTRPSRADQHDYLDAVAASRTLLHPWIDAPDTPERFGALLERGRNEDFFPFLVRARDDRRLVGAINVSNIVRGPFLNAFVGYWAFAGGQGQGLMTDALSTAVTYAFDVLGLHRLEANIQPANDRSIALAHRCGFHYEGFSPNYLMVDGATTTATRSRGKISTAVDRRVARPPVADPATTP
jgi:ribosomal-protein-alanine N-acetyltransferase